MEDLRGAALRPGGRLISIAAHWTRPVIACGDNTGSLQLVDLNGIEYGPFIVTAVDLGNGPAVRCPACLQQLPQEEGGLGQEIGCPRLDCGGRMQINPAVIGRPPRR